MVLSQARDINRKAANAEAEIQVFSSIDDDSTVLAAYARLGLSTFVQQTSPQPDLRYTLISPTLSTNPDTGDIYSGLDRLGRVKDVRWRDVSAGTDLSRIEYGYDRASNRIWRENPSDPNREHDWLYAYDGLHRLSSAERGQLNSGHTAITNDQFNQCWSLDPTGNWKGFQQDDNADGTADLLQARTANAVNEITDITNTTGAAWATPTYDPNGNSLVQPRPDLGPGASMTGVYDAWNRMVKVLDSNTLDVLLENQFDGRNFRITAVAGASPKRHYYFTDNWQCVEERIGTATTPERQHVWGMRYIDDLVLRDRATGTSTTLNERLYHLADANRNTTAIVDDSGAVQERYEFTPYGVISYFAADFTPRSSSNYDTRYTYTNREWTPFAGLYYFRNRWYDAVLGRFSSRDPIGYDGSQWNLYEYVESSPALHLDPEGLGILGWICKKVFKGKKVRKVTTIKRTVVLPKRDPTPDGFRYVKSELIGEQAAFTYKNIRTGDTMTVFQKATVVGAGSCILFTVTQFAWECTPFSDAMECGKLLGQDPDALRDWGLVEDIEEAGECDPAPFLGGDGNFG